MCAWFIRSIFNKYERWSDMSFIRNISECFLIRELIEKLNSKLIMFTFVWGFRCVLFFREQQTMFLRRGSPIFEKIRTVAEGIEARSADFWKIETARRQFIGVKRYFLKNIETILNGFEVKCWLLKNWNRNRLFAWAKNRLLKNWNRHERYRSAKYRVWKIETTGHENNEHEKVWQ